ncbi:MAG: DUF4355 domain-containing protein [Lachnospiraceae bacterium]|nr:DUF4355 domain-containing protein [Lachnospiraceae bacterium]
MRNTPWNLQLFADEGDSGSENTGNDDSGSDQGNESNKDSNKDSNKKYTDADVNRIIDKKFAEWQKKQDEAAKLKDMTDQQKAEHERDELKKQIAELQTAQSQEAMMKQVRVMLRDAKINVGDELVAPLCAEDAETTKAAVEGFVKAFNEAVQDAVKKALKGRSPKMGVTAPTMTKAEIMAVKNPQERQRLIRENWQLFQK